MLSAFMMNFPLIFALFTIISWRYLLPYIVSAL